MATIIIKTNKTKNERLLSLVAERGAAGRDGRIRLAVDYATRGGLYSFHEEGFDAEKVAKELAQKLVYSDDEMVLKGSLAGATPGACMDFEAVITSTKMDRDGDVLESKGADVDPRMPLLWQHMPTHPIGKFIGVSDRTDKRIMGKSSIIDNAMGRDAAQLLEFGALRISHGFKPTKYEQLPPDDSGFVPGYRVIRWKMLEKSLVSVPSNDEAVITAFSRHKLHDPFIKTWAKGFYDARPAVVRGGYDAKQAGAETVTACLHYEGTAGRSLCGADGSATKSVAEVTCRQCQKMVTGIPDLPLDALTSAVANTEGYSGAHLKELANFAAAIREDEECSVAESVTRALEKIKSQRELIDSVQLSGSNYRPRRDVESLVKGVRDMSLLTKAAEIGIVVGGLKPTKEATADAVAPDGIHTGHISKARKKFLKHAVATMDAAMDHDEMAKANSCKSLLVGAKAKIGECLAPSATVDKFDGDDTTSAGNVVVKMKLTADRAKMLTDAQQCMMEAHDHEEMKDAGFAKSLVKTAHGYVGKAMAKAATPEADNDDDVGEPNPETSDDDMTGANPGVVSDRNVSVLSAKFLVAVMADRVDWQTLHDVKSGVEDAIEREESRAAEAVSA